MQKQYKFAIGIQIKTNYGIIIKKGQERERERVNYEILEHTFVFSFFGFLSEPLISLFSLLLEHLHA